MAEQESRVFKYFPSIQVDFQEKPTGSAALRVGICGSKQALLKKFGPNRLTEVEEGDGIGAWREAGVKWIVALADETAKELEDLEELLGKLFIKVRQTTQTHLELQIFDLPELDESRLGYYLESLNFYFCFKSQLPSKLSQATMLGSKHTDFEFYHSVGKARNEARVLTGLRPCMLRIEDFYTDATQRIQELRGGLGGLGEGKAQVEAMFIQGEELLKHKLTLLYAVGKGSAQKPALLNLKYQGNPGSSEFVGLVGKGIVYDQGGVNFKTLALERMYNDKGGASTVYAAFWGAVSTGLKVNLTCTIALADNIVSGSCFRPSDIYKSHAGLTVEVLDTDAEGRLVLADAMSWTQDQYKLSHLIEFSTLTGANAIALSTMGGIFTNNEACAQKFLACAKIMGDWMHIMPLLGSCFKGMKGVISDLQNISDTPIGGGAMKAAAFLKHFVKSTKTKWIHVDMGGVALARVGRLITHEGPTGFGVGTVLEFLKRETFDQSAH